MRFIKSGIVAVGFASISMLLSGCFGGSAIAVEEGHVDPNEITVEVNVSGSNSNVIFSDSSWVVNVDGENYSWNQDDKTSSSVKDSFEVGYTGDSVELNTNFSTSVVLPEGGSYVCKIIVNGAVVAEHKGDASEETHGCGFNDVIEF